MPVTMNYGVTMNAWYDIVEASEKGREDEAGIAKSCKILTRLMANEAEKGVPPEKIILGGFSQGGAIALYHGLTFPERLAGIYGLSAYLPFKQRVVTIVSDSPSFFLPHLLTGSFPPLALSSKPTSKPPCSWDTEKMTR